MRIVSGGQTGVDRAALDAALEAGVPCGGWCPRGRRAEDGIIAPRYPLRETPGSAYRERTEWNVRDSDGTLILQQGAKSVGGTALTRRLARRMGMPCLVVDLSAAPDPATVAAWLREHTIRVVNIAGPRESTQPRIYCAALAFLRSLLSSLHHPGERGASAP